VAAGYGGWYGWFVAAGSWRLVRSWMLVCGVWLWWLSMTGYGGWFMDAGSFAAAGLWRMDRFMDAGLWRLVCGAWAAYLTGACRRITMR
jgi:hypothetical protein